MIENLKAGPRVVGAKQTRRAIADGTASCVFLAEDADPGVTDPFRALCGENGVALEPVESRKELGLACGVKVGAAVAALLKT